MNYDEKGKLNVTGYLPDIWRELADTLNFTYIYHLSKDKTSGLESPNGTWNGLIEMLTKNEIDVAVIPLSMAKNRIRLVDFSVPIISTG